MVGMINGSVVGYINVGSVIEAIKLSMHHVSKLLIGNCCTPSEWKDSKGRKKWSTK